MGWIIATGCFLFVIAGSSDFMPLLGEKLGLPEFEYGPVAGVFLSLPLGRGDESNDGE